MFSFLLYWACKYVAFDKHHCLSLHVYIYKVCNACQDDSKLYQVVCTKCLHFQRQFIV